MLLKLDKIQILTDAGVMAALLTAEGTTLPTILGLPSRGSLPSAC